MEVLQLLSHMNSGAGDTSYAKNCSVQKKILSLGKPAIEEAIYEMLCANDCVPESLGIADLGCSSGHNTLLVISEIIDLVHGSCRLLGGSRSPEFRVYLNDLCTNDFNTLFTFLPEFYNNLREQNGSGSGSCFVSGIPGSFYGRIFPTKSLHFVHSSSSIHWLSQVPAGLESKNKGKIYISKSSPQSVVDAYSLQFTNDFSSFLRSRSQEVVPGGRMVLSLMGRTGIDPTTIASCYQWELLALALMSMVSEGLVEEEKVDSFNAPYYAPCPEEIKQEIDKEGSFCIRRMEAVEIDWDGGCSDEAVSSGLRVAKTVRAVVEAMLVSHGFGQHIMDDLFGRYGDLVGHHLSKTRTKYINLVISVARKA